MKISKTAVATFVATSVLLGSVFTGANAETPGSTGTPAPIPTTVGTTDAKAINHYRQQLDSLNKKKAKIALSASDKAALDAYKLALAAWKDANASSLAALKVINKTRHDAIAAANRALAPVKKAFDAAKSALELAKQGTDQAAIDTATAALATASKNLADAKQTRDKAIVAAQAAYTDAVNALGPIPDKPVKPTPSAAKPTPTPTKKAKSSKGKKN